MSKPNGSTLTPAELEEARALRDELMSCRDLAVDFDGAGAVAEARATVRELLDFAAAWDAMADSARRASITRAA
jgi:hypothetical protein